MAGVEGAGIFPEREVESRGKKKRVFFSPQSCVLQNLKPSHLVSPPWSPQGSLFRFFFGVWDFSEAENLHLSKTKNFISLCLASLFFFSFVSFDSLWPLLSSPLWVRSALISCLSFPIGSSQCDHRNKRPRIDLEARLNRRLLFSGLAEFSTMASFDGEKPAP